MTRKSNEIPAVMGSSWYRRIRHSLARIGFLRSGYYLLRSIREAAQDNQASGQAELDQEFQTCEDPWDYAALPYQRDRIRREVEMLDAVRGTKQFENALEVGCAEGIFTEQLAPLCEFLLASDISFVALERTRQRLHGNERVRFAHWDLRVDPLPETYDLIVVVHALEYVRNPLYVRRARSKLTKCLRPGGYLLIGTMKVAEIYENAWWGRFLLRSGKRINNFFAGHAALKVVETEEFRLGKDYVAYDILLQKKS
jgi:SAM-dependent methyltransferase